MQEEVSSIRYFHSPVGWLRLVTSPRGVRSISFVKGEERQGTGSNDPVMEKLIRELDGYFSGELMAFSVPVDISGGTSFQRRVWRELIRIPYGVIRSYGEVAAAVGLPRGARAVGNANGANRIPIIIPCHRVVRSDGRIGGYSSGVDIKRFLLKLEGAELFPP